MKKLWSTILCGLLAVCGLSLGGRGTAQAQTEFKTALQKKYDNTIVVTCNTCHVADKEKTVRNEDFGKKIEKLLAGKDVSKRLEAVKELDVADPKKVKVKDEVTAEFLEALKKVEAMKSPEGPTYGALIKEGKLPGVNLKPKP